VSGHSPFLFIFCRIFVCRVPGQSDIMYIESRSLLLLLQPLGCVLIAYLFACTNGQGAGVMNEMSIESGNVSACGGAIICTACLQEPASCVWCLVSSTCIPTNQQNQCQNPYTDCCVTFSPQGCSQCVTKPTCGWCSNQGCRQGNRTGPSGNTGPCTGQWTFDGTCPGGSGDDSQDLAVLVGVGVSVALGTCFAFFVVTLLGILVVKRWKQREAQKDLISYEKKVRRKSAAASALLPATNTHEQAVMATDSESYSSLAPLIRDWNIEQGHTDYETLKRIDEATLD